MTDHAAPSTPSAPSAPSLSSDTPAAAAAKPDTRKIKSNPKSRRTRPRRRGASDSESSDQSDSDHSSISSASEGESDEDEQEGVDDAKPSKSASMFPDASATTPAAWADEKAGKAEEITFDEFNRGGAGTGKGKEKGGKKVFTEEQTKRYEEKKAKMKERQKVKRAELKEAKRKEREAKITNGNESAPASATVAPTDEGKKPTKTKSKKRDKEKPLSAADSSVIASTSALTIDDAATSLTPPTAAPLAEHNSSTQMDETTSPAPDTRQPPSAPRANTREAYAERLAKDPKFTPRVGGFWTHDQRHYDAGPISEGGYGGLRQMSGFWRGRGEPRGGFRGGFRGRGRGLPFAPRGGFVQAAPQGRGRELTDEIPSEDGNGKEKRLEMDKLEAELEAQRVKPAEQEKSAPEDTQESEEFPKPEAQIVPPPPVKAGKWGHEGFESMRAVDQFQADRVVLRGRGRGRPFFVRGGAIPRPHFQHPLNRPFSPAAPRRSSPLTVAPNEENSTQPTAESLLEDSSVKVKLPGATGEAVEVLPAAVAPNGIANVSGIPAVPSTSSEPSKAAATAAAPAAPSRSAFRAQAPVFVQAQSYRITAPTGLEQTATGGSASERHDPSAGPSPVPVDAGPSFIHPSAPSPQPYVVATGSENGSISSNGHFAPITQQSFLPPGVGVTPNGEYYNVGSGPAAVQQRQYYPNPRHYPQQQQQPQPYYPQSYSPDYYQNQSRHGSFSSQPGQQPPFVDGRVSPYPAYPVGNGFFSPARPSKISIRAPAAGAAAAVEAEDGLKRYPSIDQSSDDLAGPNGAYYAQHYNPYATVNVPVNGGVGAGYAQGGGGQGMVNGGGNYPQAQGYWTNGGDYGSYGEYGSW